MKHTVYDRLLGREIGQAREKYTGIRGIYGDRQWIEDMDIVNELEGHSGCVNALCWSRSGRLLASGSDDHRINIHSYHPDSSTSQFNLTTSIVTGHRSNIFSVKFMPYSNDRTIVSATDDVRIFDIERTGHSLYGSSSSGTNTRPSNRRTGIYGLPDAIVLTEGDTNAKAFKCHTDTVKRIVTEDTPFYFLTCSEDGDVRQWDIRQPPKTYPPARDRNAPSWARDADASDNVPPPLISYSRYNLDLNTVSCSPSQPHYIALGGAHLHCFLHDRRMLGRDKLAERGGLLSSPTKWDEKDELAFSQATRCVKKFAPNGQQRMGRRDTGHITACKISDADPNEIIVSWSGDWIYSFDMMRAPDATEKVDTPEKLSKDKSQRVKENNRKRKRTKSGNLSREAADRAGSRQRTESSQASVSGGRDGLALRVNYGNGQSEEIRIAPPERSMSDAEAAALRDTDHYRIAKTTIKIKKQMFTLDPNKPSTTVDGPGIHSPTFTSVLGFAASILPEMDEVARAWGYPMDPDQVDVALQNKLRDGRASARRFVQAAGTVARVLGGHLRTGSGSDVVISRYFATIQPAPNERPLPRHEQFGYDFLKAILLWLDSGLGALVEGFSSAGLSPRLPLRPDSDVDAIDDTLVPYLLGLASDSPVLDVDSSRFETDDRRRIYASEKSAVLSFASALKVPFADLNGSSSPTDGCDEPRERTQERNNAKSHWAFKVGRGVLWNAAKEVRFSFVDQAFGGLGVADAGMKAEEQALRRRQRDINPVDDGSDAVTDAEIVTRAWNEESASRSQPEATSGRSQEHVSVPETDIAHDDSGTDPISTSEDSDGDDDGEEEDEEEDEDDADSDGDVMSTHEDSDVDEEGLSRTDSGRVLWRSDFDRSYLRNTVEEHVPCAPHTRVFKGHCNVRTVKDVNYFGLNDEYVVSGSDSGHVFIWDRKTSQLLNILEGDGEVVNVVQGHPYEPTMAVSGIDHTIKIFSPDAQEQRNARLGIGVRAADPGFSSLGFGLRRRGRATRDSSSSPEDSERNNEDPAEVSDDEERPAPHGLKSRKRMHLEYEITSKNDMDRKGGREDAFITRALLAQLAQRMHAHRHGDGDTDEEGEGGTIILNPEDPNCEVM